MKEIQHLPGAFCGTYHPISEATIRKNCPLPEKSPWRDPIIWKGSAQERKKIQGVIYKKT